MKRYSHMQFIDTSDPDALSKMVEHERGEWVKADEAENEIGSLVKALSNLKSCDSRIISAEVLNAYVDNVLYGYFTDED